MIGESLLAIAQYIHQGSLNGIFYFLGERKFAASTPGIANASINGELILRPYATFPHPNVLAGYLLSSLIFIFKLLETGRHTLLKLLKPAALLLGSVALLLTLSRIAIIIWFILTFSTVIVMILKWNKLKSQLLIPGAISLLAGIIISIITFTPVISRLVGTTLSEESVTQRTGLLKSASVMIRDHAFFGVGLNNFLPALSHVQQPASSTFYLQPVHNIFLLFLAETGLVGVLFLAYFLYKTFLQLKIHPALIRLTLIIILFAVSVIGLFDHYWLTLQQGQLLLTFLLGLCWSER